MLSLKLRQAVARQQTREAWEVVCQNDANLVYAVLEY